MDLLRLSSSSLHRSSLRASAFLFELSPSSFSSLFFSLTQASLLKLKAFYLGSQPILKMNGYNLQQISFSAHEEMRGSLPIVDLNGPISQQAEGSDSKAGAELLDIIHKRSKCVAALSSPELLGTLF